MLRHIRGGREEGTAISGEKWSAVIISGPARGALGGQVPEVAPGGFIDSRCHTLKDKIGALESLNVIRGLLKIEFLNRQKNLPLLHSEKALNLFAFSCSGKLKRRNFF